MIRQTSKAQEEALRQHSWRDDRSERRPADAPPLVDLSPEWAVSPQLLAFVVGLGLLTLAVLWPWLGDSPSYSGAAADQVVTLSANDHSFQQRQPSGLLLPGPAN